jgi:hypothetical protein
VLEVSILHVSLVFRLDFRTVSTVWFGFLLFSYFGIAQIIKIM